VYLLLRGRASCPDADVHAVPDTASHTAADVPSDCESDAESDSGADRSSNSPTDGRADRVAYASADSGVQAWSGDEYDVSVHFHSEGVRELRRREVFRDLQFQLVHFVYQRPLRHCGLACLHRLPSWQVPPDDVACVQHVHHGHVQRVDGQE
jgi:hypothetical protein